MRFGAKIYKIRAARVFVVCLGLKKQVKTKIPFAVLICPSPPTFHDINNILLLVVPTRFLMYTYPMLEF
jgi:hypothetical protein